MQTEVKDNPYVAVVAKKHRNLKKKMEKIIKIEAQIQSGKALDEEQKIMYTTKSSVEKSLTDLKAILSAFEDVAKEEKEKCPEATSHNRIASEEPTEESKGNDSRASPEVMPADETNHVVSTKVAVVEQFESQPAASMNASLEVVLKAVHVFTRYAFVVGKCLPEPVERLGIMLVGYPDGSALPPTEEVALTRAIDTCALYQNDKALQEIVEMLHSEMKAASAALPPHPHFPPVGVAFHPIPTDDSVIPTSSSHLEGAAAGGGEEHVNVGATAEGAPSSTSITVNEDEKEKAVGVVDGEGKRTRTRTRRTKKRSSTSAEGEAVCAPNSQAAAAAPIVDIKSPVVDIKLVPKNSSEAASAAALAENVEISFFPAAPSTHSQQQQQPQVELSSGAHMPTSAENMMFLHDASFMNTLDYTHHQLPPIGGSLLAGFAGFGDPLLNTPLYGPGGVMGVSPVLSPPSSSATQASAPVRTRSPAAVVAEPAGSQQEEGRKRRRGKSNKESSAQPINASPAPVAVVSEEKEKVMKRESTARPLITTPAVAEPVVEVKRNDITPIAPVMGVGAALAYINSTLKPQTPIETPAPVPATVPAATSVSAVVTEKGGVVGLEEGVAAERKHSRRSGKKNNAGENATTENPIPAPTSSVCAAVASSVAPAVTAALAVSARDSAVVEVENGTLEEGNAGPAPPKRTRGSRGRGGRGKSSAAACDSADAAVSTTPAAAETVGTVATTTVTSASPAAQSSSAASGRKNGGGNKRNNDEGIAPEPRSGSRATPTPAAAPFANSSAKQPTVERKDGTEGVRRERKPRDSNQQQHEGQAHAQKAAVNAPSADSAWSVKPAMVPQQQQQQTSKPRNTTEHARVVNCNDAERPPSKQQQQQQQRKPRQQNTSRSTMIN